MTPKTGIYFPQSTIKPNYFEKCLLPLARYRHSFYPFL